MPFNPYEGQAVELAKRQAIIDALDAKTKNPLDMSEGLIGVLGNFLTRRGLESDRAALATEKQQFGDQYNSDKRQGIEKLVAALGGQGQPMIGPMQEGMARPELPTNPRAAIVEAMTSNIPEIQALGQSLLKQQTEGQLGMKDVFDKASPEAQLAMVRGGGMQAFAPKPRDPMTVGGMLINPTDNSVIPIKGASWPTRTNAMGSLEQQNPSTGEWDVVDKAPKINVSQTTSPIIKGQSEGLQSRFKGIGEHVNELGKVAQGSAEIIPVIARLQEKAATGMFTGKPAQIATATANLAQSFGVPVDVQKLANSETFNAEMTKIWVDMIKNSGGARGWTAEETKRIEQSLPQITQSPQAINELLTLMGEKAKTNINTYQLASEAFDKASMSDDPSVYTQAMKDVYLPSNIMQAAGDVKGSTVVSLADYIKSQRGR